MANWLPGRARRRRDRRLLRRPAAGLGALFFAAVHRTVTDIDAMPRAAAVVILPDIRATVSARTASTTARQQAPCSSWRSCICDAIRTGFNTSCSDADVTGHPVHDVGGCPTARGIHTLRSGRVAPSFGRATTGTAEAKPALWAHYVRSAAKTPTASSGHVYRPVVARCTRCGRNTRGGTIDHAT